MREALSGAASASTTVDASGNYSFSSLPAGSYTVIPSQSGFSFTPASQNVMISNANATANFSSVAVAPGTFSISGTISGAGGAAATVVLSGTTSGSTTADASGNYSFSALPAGSYTVIPSKAGFTFTPASQNVTITNVNMTANFSSTAVPPGGGGTGIQAVNHIIFLAEENRSFDHYFGKLNDYRRSRGLPADVNGLPDDCSSTNSDWTVPCSAMNLSPNSSGIPTTPIYAFHLKTQCIEGLSPDWIVAHWDFQCRGPHLQFSQNGWLCDQRRQRGARQRGKGRRGHSRHGLLH